MAWRRGSRRADFFRHDTVSPNDAHTPLPGARASDGTTSFITSPPLAAIALSAVIFASIYATTWAQDVYLRKQAALVSRMKAMKLPTAEAIALKCSGDLVESESTTRRNVLDVTAVESSEAKEARAILCRMDFHRGSRRENI